MGNWARENRRNREPCLLGYCSRAVIRFETAICAMFRFGLWIGGLLFWWLWGVRWGL